MIDKEEQRRRAAELDAERMRQGFKAAKVEWPTLPKKSMKLPKAQAWQFPPTNQPPTSAPAWPFPTPNTPTSTPTYLAPPQPSKNGVQAVAFRNSFGQEIQVGQKVIAVTSGYSHAIHVRQGTYVGCRYNDRGGVQSVTVEIVHSRTGKVRRTTLPGKRIYPTI